MGCHLESAPWREKNWRTVVVWVGVGIGGSRMIVAGGKIHTQGRGDEEEKGRDQK